LTATPYTFSNVVASGTFGALGLANLEAFVSS
jgi:hypothetical protein